MTDFRISLYPATWLLWPVWRRSYQHRHIFLGPIVIDWRVAE